MEKRTCEKCGANNYSSDTHGVWECYNCHRTIGVPLSEEELKQIHIRAEANLEKFNVLKKRIEEAAKYAGITFEQAINFMDHFASDHDNSLDKI
ncbi:MAG TPA: hypothetical protein VK190_03615 [Pseudoneobacillus sp.]|nr:hypothetical protein [Pseudoneobacillus sp.]